MIDAALLITGYNYAGLDTAPTDPNPYPLTVGNVVTFQQAGVALNNLSHSDTATHYALVLAGSFTVTRTAGALTANAGDVLTFAAGDVHGFTSLAPGKLFLGVRYAAGATTLADCLAAAQAQLAALTAQVQALNTALAVPPSSTG